MQDAVAPGWYAAAGDPPGTQRYWDGSVWVGDPVLVPGAAHSAPSQSRAPANRANYGQRVIGVLVDLALWIPSFVFAFAVDDGLITDSSLESISFALIGVTFLLQLGNVWILQGITGQSLGKKVAKTRIIKEADGAPVGIGLMIARLVIRAILTPITCYLYWLADWLWPAFDPDNQRLTDKMLKLHVVNVD